MENVQQPQREEFDVSNAAHVREAVIRHYDRRTPGVDDGWAQWLRPNPSPSEFIREAVAETSADARALSCGCGFPFPEVLVNSTVLDIGCGSGADCGVLSKLVGRDGKVVGLDLCPTLISDARKHVEAAGQDNVEFVCCDAEQMTSDSRVMANGPYDVIVANCSLSQVRDCARKDLMHNIYSLLKPGGELYLCDVFVTVDVSACVRKSPKAWVEGFAGAWMWPVFVDAAQGARFSKPLLVSTRKLEMTNERRRELAGGMGVFGAVVDKLHKLEEASGLQICAATYRLFKPAPVDRMSELAKSPLNSARIVFQPSPGMFDTQLQLTKKLVCRQSRPSVISKELALLLQSTRLAKSLSITPAQGMLLLPENNEPFFPKAVTISAKTTIAMPCMPKDGLTMMNNALPVTGPGSGSVVPMPAPSNLAHIFNNDPVLKELRDLVADCKINGCGPRGC